MGVRRRPPGLKISTGHIVTMVMQTQCTWGSFTWWILINPHSADRIISPHTWLPPNYYVCLPSLRVIGMCLSEMGSHLEGGILYPLKQKKEFIALDTPSFPLLNRRDCACSFCGAWLISIYTTIAPLPSAYSQGSTGFVFIAMWNLYLEIETCLEMTFSDKITCEVPAAAANINRKMTTWLYLKTGAVILCLWFSFEPVVGCIYQGIRGSSESHKVSEFLHQCVHQFVAGNNTHAVL